jgi:hypothetical protein
MKLAVTILTIAAQALADSLTITTTKTQYINTARQILIQCSDCPQQDDSFNLPRPFYNKDTGEYDAQCISIEEINDSNFTCQVGGTW